MLKGVLFDIDGTLVDSNKAHAAAWQEAYAQHGFTVDFEDILMLIGMGGDKLIAALTPELSEDEGVGRQIKEARPKIFLEKYAPKLVATPGSRKLVEAIQAKGLRTIVATSAKKDELSALLKAAQVEDLLTEATTSDDADNSKPDPDIVQVALDKLGISADEAVMIGDTPYDIEAAAKAGVQCIALRCGGWSDEDLPGAIAIYDDPAALCAHLDTLRGL